MIQPPFVNRTFYHVYNRGTERRETFLDDADRARFITQLVVFNDVDSARKDLRIRRSVISSARPKPYANLVAFALMPNHFHLLLEQVEDDGVTRLMQRLGTGYTMYFNKRHSRTGRLFEMTYKALGVEDDGYFTHLTRYIHLNPLELAEPDWKSCGVADPRKSLEYLAKYPWSSAQHYLGKRRLDFIHDAPVHAHFATKGEYCGYLMSAMEGRQRHSRSWRLATTEV